MPSEPAEMTQPQPYDFFVGTFNTPNLYTLRFTPPRASSPTSATKIKNSGFLKIVQKSSVVGSHSWLHLHPPRRHGVRNLYATAWTEPPSVVAYAVDSPTSIRLLNTAPTRSRSGYVAASDVALYSAGGATGEVYSLDPETGAIVSPTSATNGNSASKPIKPLQDLSFVDTSASQRDNGTVMDFGGLRHGAHSADLSPDGQALYVADIGRNCIWTYTVSPSDGSLTLGEKHISPRANDGPRHVWPHPSGRFVYCLQEHTSMVDVFSTHGGGRLQFDQGVRIIPAEECEGEFWADEVRTSLSNGDAPKYLYASTRGLEHGKKGYVAVYQLTADGRIDTSQQRNGAGGTSSYETDERYAGLLDMYTTATSGGWANAVQPGPTVDGIEYLALTDSEEGLVFVLAWDGKKLTEAARVTLGEGEGAATAVWL
ncbi:uncharacterized protein A1O9_07217 [Exophiala aquamarina CBS 119918]|uniref:Muconate cycloisomerase 1 n=1 Tax=Exophiala aquamarina CBS 119918 TaxID=1182545 RepID=A0A072PB75_9EURO|nr:uncharacterized protein A1O9_07217 [Exophiala aquamarina CBS 119918]KEF57027.1 hypothetical protein A1O9_07217 [Exophiala aquamarina CBS 119918]